MGPGNKAFTGSQWGQQSCKCTLCLWDNKCHKGKMTSTRMVRYSAPIPLSLGLPFLCSLLPHSPVIPLLVPSPTAIPCLGSSLGEEFAKDVWSWACYKTAPLSPLFLPLSPNCFPSLYSSLSSTDRILSLSFPLFFLETRSHFITTYSKTAIHSNPTKQQELLSYLVFKLLLAFQDILTIALNGPVSLSLLLPGNLLLLPHLLNLTNKHTLWLELSRSAIHRREGVEIQEKDRQENKNTWEEKDRETKGRKECSRKNKKKSWV